MSLTQEYQLFVIQLSGALDLHNNKALSVQFANLLPQPHHLWVIDLVNVDFIDSSGLSTLVNGLATLRQNGCRLVICNLQAPVRIIFELTRLDSVFEIFESYEAFLTTVNVRQ
ncbi:MAG: STAS domain-containing protein [Goleter apudmare HA4340-LM2]|jgi:anti-anti-sigma factor|nr:STAS domain-containing protein [Goleter apudmare HA4340-LM2]